MNTKKIKKIITPKIGSVKKSPVVKTKKYTIEWLEHENGDCSMKRINDGFSAFELLGIITMTQQEIIAQIGGKIKPNHISRNVVK